HFPSYMTDMIEIGAQTGKLEQVLRNLAAYYDNQENIKNHVKNAVIYPSVLLLLMLVVITLLITKVLPLFAGVFMQFGSSLSPFAQILLYIGSGIQKYIIIIVILLLVLIAASIIIYVNDKLRDAFNKKIIIKIFSKRKVSVTLSSAKFADALSICMSCGMDVDKSLQLTSKINTNTILQKKINNCMALLEQGTSSSEAFIKSQIFPSLFGRMLAVGYKTGSADEVMREIAAKLQVQAWEEINSSINRVEPALVIVLSVIVGVILLSVMIPLMSIMSAIG
ncbi:MAG: type II secretion system F family protein, partial [Eubacteriaceae bacterium]|nr:type II secretion system F family protein [Eubacteriaceae bacterium]